MNLTLRPYCTEEDYFRIRNFLREVFLLNDRLEHSWHVARLDYWRWHFIKTCQLCPPFDQVTIGWETPEGKLVAILHPICHDEIRMHVHPQYRSAELEEEILSYAELHYSDRLQNGNEILYIPVFSGDTLRQDILTRRGFTRRPGWNHHYWSDLDIPLPKAPVPEGYVIRSMGDGNEHPSRSWCSWQAFHSEEPKENYDGDFSWFVNIQSAPLYRRDLDIVAVSLQGEVSAFCTIYYDDFTRSAVTVLVGVAAQHWRRGLGKTVMIEGMQRLKHLGCTRVFATASEEPSDALYRSVMTQRKVTDTWAKEFMAKQETQLE